MKKPSVKLVFFYFMSLGFISLNFEMAAFKLQEKRYILLYWVPATVILSLTFIGFFYHAKSTKKFLIFAAISYFLYASVRAVGSGSGGYIRRSYHEVLVDGHLTNFGISDTTFNVFLAPLVLAINMYIFDILFKKRFQKKQLNNQKKI